MIRSGRIRPPGVTLSEYSEVEGTAAAWAPTRSTCRRPRRQDHRHLGRARAFTPTCSAKHAQLTQKRRGAGRPRRDEIWCLAVNDPSSWRAWARDQKTGGQIRMLADGDVAFAKATGLTLDLNGKGPGLRSNRYSMLVRDGKVATLNIEALRQVRGPDDGATFAGASPRSAGHY